MRTEFLPAPDLAPGRPLLIVTGFMGTGKTSAGRAAARRLGVPFVDLDEVVARRLGLDPAAAIDRLGLTAFRETEAAAVRDAARLSGAVVATGGGAPLDRESFGRLGGAGRTAVLRAEPSEILGRLGPDAAGSRPLLRPDPAARVPELLGERAAAYDAAGPSLDTTGRSAEAVGAELAAGCPVAAGATVEVDGPEGRYPVVIREGVLDDLGGLVAERLPGSALAVVVADRAVESVAERAAASLEGAGLRVERALLPAGEAAKSLRHVEGLWERFAAAGLDRTGAVVAIGGGAALDAAGFAAATFARGVPLVNVPTTLLAMADAALGGKVAIDAAGAKNSVGAFHHPRLVAADPATLATLSPEDLRGGMAEIVKAAVVASPLSLDVIESGGADRLWLIEQAVRVKAAYVAADPADRGLRHSLNLGHTFAHGIEAASRFTVPHGRAVAIGLVAAARLGAAAARTDPALAGRLSSILRALGLPVAPPEALEPDAVVAAMATDKKRRGGRLVLVVPAPGGVDLLESVDESVVTTALRGAA